MNATVDSITGNPPETTDRGRIDNDVDEEGIDRGTVKDEESSQPQSPAAHPPETDRGGSEKDNADVEGNDTGTVEKEVAPSMKERIKTFNKCIEQTLGTSMNMPTLKSSKKRERRVGKTPKRKLRKVCAGDIMATATATEAAHSRGLLNTEAGAGVGTAATNSGAGEEMGPAATPLVPPSDTAGPVLPLSVLGMTLPNLTATTTALPTIATHARDEPPSPSPRRPVSKHDQKWNAMMVKLLEFKATHTHTLVPQNYKDDPRLGRWVHYQRVEYWLLQQAEPAKITEERILRLEAIDFEWDPQKAKWEQMFEKLKMYKKENSHCDVPKSYEKDLELANWVRNQRLEHANQRKIGKKSRMTPERYTLLDEVGFKWSIPTPARGNRKSVVESWRRAQQTAAAMSEEDVAHAAPDTTTLPVATTDAELPAITAPDIGGETLAQKPCIADVILGEEHVAV